LIQQLKRLNRSDIRVIAGGVIPEIDYDFLKNCGVLQIFGPGTVVSASAVEILNELLLHVKV
ncbi:MAG: methylmalonyl-CoA mutase, partial [Bacteroidia bacterium]